MKPRSHAGERYGRLTIVDTLPAIKGFVKHVALCDCGTVIEVRGADLRSGNTRSCGCFALEVRRANRRTHGQSLTPTYKSWLDMHARCECPTRQGYARYGGRGIRVCKRWAKFEHFLADMGERPPGMTLERRNNDGNYTPANCCWASRSVQAHNKSTTRFLTFNGETKCLSDWALELGITPATLHWRLAHWPIAKALSVAPRSW